MSERRASAATTWADVAQNTVNCICILGLCGLLTYCMVLAPIYRDPCGQALTPLPERGNG